MPIKGDPGILGVRAPCMIPAMIAAGGYRASAEVALLGVIPSGEQLLEGRGCSVAGRWGYGIEEVHGAGDARAERSRASRRGADGGRGRFCPVGPSCQRRSGRKRYAG